MLESIPFVLGLGFIVALLGTLVGAGGGFVLMPILALLLADMPSERLTAISMAVVFSNALAGSIAYARMKRIDFYGGKRFAIAAVPGAAAGALCVAFIDRSVFDRLLGFVLLSLSLYLLFKARKGAKKDAPAQEKDAEGFKLEPKKLRLGIILSLGVGFLSSLLGIGGGIIQVPALVYLLKYPIHLATATSLFVLTCTSAVATIEHIIRGNYSDNLQLCLCLSSSAVIGALVGAKLSTRIKGPLIISGLAVAMILVASRILYGSFSQ